MLRLVLIFLVVVVVLSLFFLPKFRNALWLTLAIVLSLVATIIWLDNREREISHSTVPLDQVELQNMEALPGLNALSYIIKGRILNHSSTHVLREVVFGVILKDCDEQRCQTVAEEKGRVSREVPPTQARDFQVTVPFSSVIRLQGQSQWSFRVLDVNDR